MQILLDEKEIALDLSCLCTFGAMIEEVARRVSLEGRIVHGVVIDGKEISPAEEQEMHTRPVEEIGSLHVRTTTREALLMEAIEGAICLSEALCHDIRTVVASIRENDVSSAETLCISCIESLETFLNLTVAIIGGVYSGAFILPGSASSNESIEFPESPTEIIGVLKRFIEDEWRDWPQVASTLENEISPHIEEWAAFFSAMK